MNLYRSLGHIWTGTQKDAKAAGEYEAIDVPTDKPSLLAFLNEMEARLAPEPEPADTVSEPDPDRPYRNGDPTFIFKGSRNPEAIFNCTNCGHQNRNQGR